MAGRLHTVSAFGRNLRSFAAALLLMVTLQSCKESFSGVDGLSTDNPVLERNHGITDSPVWMRVIPPASGDGRFVLIDNPHINKLTLSDGKGTVLVETGDIKPFSDRPFAHRRFILPLPQSDDPDTLSLLLDKRGENLSYAVRMLDARSLDRELVKDRVMTGAVIGFFAAAVILSLALFFFNLNFKYLFFFLYVALALAWILNDAGLFYEWLWPYAPGWHQSSRGFFSSLAMILFVAYLSRNASALMSRGLRSVLVLLLSLLGCKVLLSIVVARGHFPESLKSLSLHFNAMALLTLMGTVALYLVWNLRRNLKDAFEHLAVITYCLFVVHLSARELGMGALKPQGLHGFDAMLFFPFQCLFMAVHLYGSERDRERRAQKELMDYRVAQQRELDSRVREVEEEERKRVARNIHDEIGSIFAALKYQLLSLAGKGVAVRKEDMDRLLGLAEQGISRQYSIIDDLLLEIRTGQSLKEALETQIRLSVTREDIEATLTFDVDESRWSDFQKTQVYRIVSELLTNTIKHGHASRVAIALQGEDPVRISYRDDGRGFDPGVAGEGRGLTNLRMRVKAMEGSMAVHSGQEGAHFEITIHIGHD